VPPNLDFKVTIFFNVRYLKHGTRQNYMYHKALKIRTDGSHAGVCELGSIGVFGFYCNIVNFNFIPLGYGDLLAESTSEPKLVGAELGSIQKMGTPYLFMRPLKLGASNLVYNLGLKNSIPRNNV